MDCGISAGACCVGIRTKVWGSGAEVSADLVSASSDSSFGFGSFATEGDEHTAEMEEERFRTGRHIDRSQHVMPI